MNVRKNSYQYHLGYINTPRNAKGHNYMTNENVITGLTAEEVRSRIAAGAVNKERDDLTPTVGRIFRKNIFTGSGMGIPLCAVDFVQNLLQFTDILLAYGAAVL